MIKLLKFSAVSLIILVLFVFANIGGVDLKISTRAVELNEDVDLLPQPVPAPPPITPLHLTLSPVSLILETDPQEPVFNTIKVFNNETAPEYLRAEIQTFFVDRDDHQISIREFEEGEAHQEWLKLSEKTFVVNPGEWKTIDLTFSPPRTAALNYYYAVVIKRDTQIEVVDTPQAIVAGAPAILVLANVYSPFAKQELQLVSFQTTKGFYEFLPSIFEITIRNTGNVHISPKGSVFIKQGDNSDLATLNINPHNNLILPDTQRTYIISWNDGFPVWEEVEEVSSETNVMEVKKRLNWDGRFKDFRIGKFTADLLIAYDSGDRDVPIGAQTSFWIIPWRMFAFAAGSAVILMILGAISRGIITKIRNKN
jgi:hypothetical protein